MMQKGKLCLPNGLPLALEPSLAFLARCETPLFLAHRLDPRRRALAVAHVTAYDLGYKSGLNQLAHALNPFADHTHNHGEWARGWIRGAGEQLRVAFEPSRGQALIHPHPSLTAKQIELLCRREGLALAHLGRERFVLVQTSAPAQTMLRIAHPGRE